MQPASQVNNCIRASWICPSCSKLLSGWCFQLGLSEQRFDKAELSLCSLLEMRGLSLADQLHVFQTLALREYLYHSGLELWGVWYVVESVVCCGECGVLWWVWCVVESVWCVVESVVCCGEWWDVECVVCGGEYGVIWRVWYDATVFNIGGGHMHTSITSHPFLPDLICCCVLCLF